MNLMSLFYGLIHRFFRPQSGCLQYHRSLTGRFKTFNFDDGTTTHLADQNYSICLKRFSGMLVNYLIDNGA